MPSGYNFERKITLEQRNEIVALYFEGYTTISIGKKYGIDSTTIYHYLKGKRRKKVKGIKWKTISSFSLNKNKTMMYKDYIAENKARAKKNK